jgi:hypothetical protein
VCASRWPPSRCHTAQVDFLKLLYDKLLELHLKHADTSDERYYPRPSFKVGGMTLISRGAQCLKKQSCGAKTITCITSTCCKLNTQALSAAGRWR